MKKHFITPLREALEPFCQTRFEQIQLEMEHNSRRYPQYHRCLRDYQNCAERFERNVPELKQDLDALVSALHLCYSELAVEAYRQGARDCLRLLRETRCTNGSGTCRKEELR